MALNEKNYELINEFMEQVCRLASLNSPRLFMDALALSKTKISKQHRENRAIAGQNITPNIENSQPMWYN